MVYRVPVQLYGAKEVDNISCTCFAFCHYGIKVSKCEGYNVLHHRVSQDSIILHVHVLLSVIVGLKCLNYVGHSVCNHGVICKAVSTIRPQVRLIAKA